MEKMVWGSLSVYQTGISETEILVGELFQDPPPASRVLGPQILYIQMYLTMVVKEVLNGEKSKYPISKQEGGTTLT